MEFSSRAKSKSPGQEVCFSEDPTLNHIVNEVTASQLTKLSLSASGQEDFYERAKKYWSSVPPTIDGILGGFAEISPRDIQSSSQLLGHIFRLKPRPGRSRALDCGAGIGRVTKHLLLRSFDTVDLVEQCPQFAAQIPKYVGPSAKLGEIYTQGLQEFTPAEGKYDVIWTQWVLGHLTDDDLVAFWRRCVHGLAKNGVIVMKENAASSNEVELDAEDSSVTRPLKLIRLLIREAGLREIRIQRQEQMPKGLFPIYMIVMRPNTH
ncbi:N-terminal Xaa-Pro-Lys N-methyltransferase 1 [Phlebotomus argentipes]|uniref:N-terminal Xaa-Pro-Lys N-methyltransferase 1 n=1 Tax=Phlebotomus argentipes TaxID=94469 RepID=UPI0028935D7E|nr:N-terminal Xaa-Pro-Lys N-methyltransferase 1 [Phlebotomus argentipes]